EERLEGDHAEILVDRCVEDGAAARVQVGELLFGDATGEADTAVRQPLQPLTVGPLARDHDLETTAGRRLDEQVDPLGPVEPADGEEEVAVAVAAVGELLGRVRQLLRLVTDGAA